MTLASYVRASRAWHHAINKHSKILTCLRAAQFSGGAPARGSGSAPLHIHTTQPQPPKPLRNMEATFVGGVGVGVLISAVVAAAITLLRRRRGLSQRVRSDPDEVVPQDHPPSDDWSRFGGDEIEAALRGGAIALLDGAWVVRCAARAGGRIQRRQDLPDEAFLSLDAIKAAGIVRDALPVAVVSYPWLHPEHPDPRGDTLRLLARVLEAFITHEKEGKQQPWALFWDFASLHQHSEGGRRTDAEENLFKQGLSSLNHLYAHQYTTVLRVTRTPPGWPKEYDLPQDASTASYDNRGWCFTETCWSSLTKSASKSLDLGNLVGNELNKKAILAACRSHGGRRPPLLPRQFEAAVSAKKFTNGKEDCDIVCRLYREAFKDQFTKVGVLNYHSLGWGDGELWQLAVVLGELRMARLKKLCLDGNSIGDLGVRALAAEALGRGGLPLLETLKIDRNFIGEEGAKALAEVLTAPGALPALKEVISDEEVHEQPDLVRVCRERGVQLERPSRDGKSRKTLFR